VYSSGLRGTETDCNDRFDRASREPEIPRHRMTASTIAVVAALRLSHVATGQPDWAPAETT
jgi:hypothetical protein